MNLATVGQDELSTSEEEDKRKPTVPPRTRLHSFDAPLTSQKAHQNNKDKSKSKLLFFTIYIIIFIYVVLFYREQKRTWIRQKNNHGRFRFDINK